MTVSTALTRARRSTAALALDPLPASKVQLCPLQFAELDKDNSLITGKWADIGKFKGPVLRGLAARAPYFHNGSASTVQDVLEFYNTKFQMGLSVGERDDLIAFLRSL